MTFASMDKLKQETWTTRQAAVRALKRNGYAERGVDYELRETEGIWRICPLEDDAASLPPVVPAKKPALQRIKKAAATKAAIVPRRAPAMASAVAPPAEPAPTAPEAPSMAPPAPTAAVLSLFPDLPPAPPDEPAVPDGADLAPLPVHDAPFYSVRIDAAHVRQNSVVLQALELSRQTKLPMAICDPDGAVLRVIDHMAVRARRKAAPRAGATGGARGPRGEGKGARGVALLSRPEGASAAELTFATGWPIGPRHIRRLAKISNMQIVDVGERHWRLVKGAAK